MADLDKVLEKLNSIETSITGIHERVENLEKQPTTQKSDGASVFSSGFSVGPRGPLGTLQQDGAGQFKVDHEVQYAESPGPTSLIGASEDIQGEFSTIKDSVSRVKLSPDLRVSDSNRGIKRSDQPFANVVQKCGRYAETTLKLLLSINENRISDELLVDLWKVQVAQVRYLQEEHSSILVHGQFNPDVARLYRTLQKNTSGFSPRALDILEKATTISAANTPRGQPPRGRGSYGYGRFGQRGGRGRNFQQRGHFGGDFNREFNTHNDA